MISDFAVGDADAGRRRLVVGEELRDHLAAEVVEADEAADQQASAAARR